MLARIPFTVVAIRKDEGEVDFCVDRNQTITLKLPRDVIEGLEDRMPQKDYSLDLPTKD